MSTAQVPLLKEELNLYRSICDRSRGRVPRHGSSLEKIGLTKPSPGADEWLPTAAKTKPMSAISEWLSLPGQASAITLRAKTDKFT